MKTKTYSHFADCFVHVNATNKKEAVLKLKKLGYRATMNNTFLIRK